jgi:hypothetical protein
LAGVVDRFRAPISIIVDHGTQFMAKALENTRGYAA